MCEYGYSVGNEYVLKKRIKLNYVHTCDKIKCIYFRGEKYVLIVSILTSRSALFV